MANYLGQTDLPRGFRNNNPGNLIQTTIKWQGKIPLSENSDSRFEQFQAMKWGFRAMMKDIFTDVKRGSNTIEKLINEYAPSHENDTYSYIQFVANRVGVEPKETINLTSGKMKQLARAIAIYENGFAYADLIEDSDVNEAEQLANLDYEAIKKKKYAYNVGTCYNSNNCNKKVFMNYLRVPVVAFFGIAQNFILNVDTGVNIVIGLITIVWIYFKIQVERKKLKDNG